ncbi:MAG TPA: PPE domain-containing protein [Pseudonocardiaceae bacterium]|jgi:hypothetical protein
MVRIGGKALNGQTNWAAMTHEQLYAAVVGGNEPSVVYGVSDKWISLGNNMLDSAMNLHQQVAATNTGWQGEAADSARNAVSQLVGWSGKAAQTAQFMGHQLNQQGQVMETAKNNMPGPVNFDLQTAAAVEPGLSGFANSVVDSQAGQQMAAEAHARAIDVATTMENDSAQIDAATPEFEPVPTVISPNQIGTLTPRLHGTPAQPAGSLQATQGTAPQGYEPFQQATANGSPGQTNGTPQQPPTAGAPGTSQSNPGGSSSTQAQGYQPPSSPNYGGYNPSPGYGSNQQPVSSGPSGSNPGGYSPPNIYTQPSGSTSTSSYPGPGPQIGSNPPAWPIGGGPTSGNPGGGNPYGSPGGSGPFGSGPIGSGPFGSGPYGSGPYGNEPIPPGEEMPGGGGPSGGIGGGAGGGGAGGGGADSVRGYQPGAISSRLGSGGGATGARANAGSSAASAAEAEGEAGAGGAGSLGAAGRSGSTTGGMPGGSGGSKRKEEDKEHKSARYVEGEEIFEPLGGELPPSVIGERRTRPTT